MSDPKEKPVDQSNPAGGPEGVVPSGKPAMESPVVHVESASAEAAKPEATSSASPAVTPPDPQAHEEWNRQVRQRMRIQSRRGFLGLGAGILAGFGAFEWLTSRRDIDGVPWPFRKSLEVNEQLAHDYLTTGRLAPTFSKDRISEDRVNGDVGLDDDVDVSTWKLQVEGLAGQDEPLMLDLDAIKKLPRMEMITEFKCIEGWSVIVQWAGVRFSDFMKAYPPATRSGGAFSSNHPEDLPPYVSMETPDGDYYVGLDIESALHPQTMLCYERNAEHLSQDHGAPLRLVIPVKYGVKNLKRIGAIRYALLRPADYWAERGYDWYIGL